jgi:type IV pilus assembly protein PilF
MSQRRRSSFFAGPRVLLLSTLGLSGCAATVNDTPTNLDRTLALNVTMGVEYMEQGNLSRAQAKLDRALEIGADDPRALQAQALLYQRQQEHQLAERFFERALAKAPDFTQARNNYAAFLFDRGHIAKACGQLERATRDLGYTKRARLFTNLGLCRRRLGDLDAARASLQQAQAMAPREAHNYLALAQIEQAQGHVDQARQMLQRYRRLAGDTPQARRLAGRLAGGRDEATPAETRPLPHNAPRPEPERKAQP